MSDLISRADAIEAVRQLRDTDGDVWGEALDTLTALPSADAVQLKQTDTLIIADALRYLAQDAERHPSDRARADALREQVLKYGASMCHSADAVQGEWTHDGSMWENRWVCNKCGHKIFERQTNFCPNCGARMTPYKGGEE